MHNAVPTPPPAINEPVLGFEPGSPEKALLKAELTRMAGEQIEIPLIIGGKRVTTGRTIDAVVPHRHGHVLAKVHMAGPAELEQAVAAAGAARADWENLRWEERAAVFLRAADLLAGPWRMKLNAATMLNQSKTCHQAEIDAACELIDFWRFNVEFAAELYGQQPQSGAGMWNSMELRPLEGFVLSVTPFNFTSIAGNLPTAPALMGNVGVWKPSRTSLLSGYYLMELLEEAGLPPGVINFMPGSGTDVAAPAIDHPEFAGLHFTGSTEVFQLLWRRAAEKLQSYKSYPRMVGETGGKDFIIAHPSADDDALVTAIVRGSFEYQGQKCSAASRVYVSESQWKRIRDKLVDVTSQIAMGDVTDFRNFMGAVIDRTAFETHKRAIEGARAASDAKVLCGGETDDSEGYYVRPTIILADNPRYATMVDELFGPIVTVHVYADDKFTETLELVDTTSPYALTGGVFANDRRAIVQATTALRNAAGNFYINDKPTGAVVGQQPFGGARASGTNDKAGSYMNLLRWVSARTLKETLAPPTSYPYPFMQEE